jgi:hypothetical protein
LLVLTSLLTFVVGEVFAGDVCFFAGEVFSFVGEVFFPGGDPLCLGAPLEVDVDMGEGGAEGRGVFLY